MYNGKSGFSPRKDFGGRSQYASPVPRVFRTPVIDSELPQLEVRKFPAVVKVAGTNSGDTYCESCEIILSREEYSGGQCPKCDSELINRTQFILKQLKEEGTTEVICNLEKEQNPYDPHAVVVYGRINGKKIKLGYIPMKRSPEDTGIFSSDIHNELNSRFLSAIGTIRHHFVKNIYGIQLKIDITEV